MGERGFWMTAIGVDLGGSWIKAGVVLENGDICAKKTVPTGAKEGAAAVTGRIEALCREMAERGPAGPCAGIGLAVAGRVSADGKTVLACTNLPYRNEPLAEILAAKTGLAVRCENDAALAAVGEARWGAAQGVGSAPVLTVGPGIGGAVLKGGKPLLTGLAGELGHMAIAMDGEACGCGRRGCCEAYLSVPALLRDCARAMEREPGILSELCGGDPEKLDGRAPFEAAARGDPAAKRVLSRYFGIFAETLVSFTNLFRPELILIGGGLSGAGEAMFAPLRARYREAMARHVYGDCPPDIRPAALGNDAGLLGAAGLIFVDRS